jgi:RNA polymerase sigma factor (sigma-70 family)
MGRCATVYLYGMDAALLKPLSPSAQDSEIAAVVRRERGRLLSFILKRVRDATEAEDVLQEALYELVNAYRLMQPVEQAGAWLMRVARNRIIDRFRKRSPRLLGDIAAQAQGEEGDEGAEAALQGLLPVVEDGPDAELVRGMLMEELDGALAELPAQQREVFVAHELEGVSFKELSARWGVGINTLLSRKRYAVLRLRERLRTVYEEWLEDR